ncbi:MAG TPA: STAS/SEC14 domain-containing protein [Flavobacteriia bacterium]|jgi:hypothetical protein|nr:STAS/SEC14 domain-containing protein [Flavobacteriia bacterium]
MIKEVKSLHTNTLVYELEEFISQYELDIIDKGIETVLKDFDTVNLMLYINVEGENLASFIKAFQLGIKYWDKINKIAYIGDKKKWKTLIAIDNIFTKFKEKYFDIDEIAKAWDWINN